MIHDRFSYLLEFGYTDIDITNIIKKVPIILKEDFLNELNNRIDCLKELGFDNTSIILMTCNNPYIFLYSNENITTKYNDLKSLDFTNEEINNIIINFPVILGYDFNTIRDKIEYFESIDLRDMIINNSKCLFYSINLIRARNIFLFNRKYKLEDLFLSDSLFYKKFKISRDDLLKGDF